MNDIEREVGGLFANLDAQVMQKLAGQPVTCSRGCAGCCHQLTAIGIGEALYIGQEVATWDDWREWSERFFRAAKEMTAPDVTNATWFDRAVPCVFLADDRSCRIYDRRPSACRYHWVKSPAENCYPDAVEPNIERYDFHEVFNYVIKLDLAIFTDNEYLGQPTIGLLPHLVLYVLGFAIEPDDQRFIAGLLAQLPTPQEWTERRMRRNGQPARSA
jgi:Fe-S-cluster containining protein